MEYGFRDIEKKWKDYWQENNVYKVSNTSNRPKYYILDMFPYPSGAGLHVGHPLGYIASDIYARYKRLSGYNVLHPMGYDAFGLPAEQYALETGQHPAVTTEKNIARYREQLDNIGFCYDWDREVRTSDPKYYKWTQWIFLQLFHSWFDKKENKAKSISSLIAIFEKEGNANTPAPGTDELHFDATTWNSFNEKEKRDTLMNYRIAYLGHAVVWWCEALGTVLANDEVVNGISERGGHPVERKQMRQWFLRITEYAERLLTSLDKLEWSDAMKEMQRNWIGKSNGAEIDFKLAEGKGEITVFTTRPDTIFGVDFMVLAPEHELVDAITTPEQKQAIDEYRQYVKSRSERERMSEVKQVTGSFTGAYAIHPFTKKEIPVWIAEYVLAGYGTGAIMAVPSGDDRDHAFAKHFNIPITNIFGNKYNGENAYSDKTGKIENSDFLNGMDVATATDAAVDALVKIGVGKKRVNYRLRDAGFSRQRYWGEPFPVIYVDGIAYGNDEEIFKNNPELQKLPVELPHVESYKPGPEGQGPLANLGEWVYLTPGPSPQVERGAIASDSSQVKGEVIAPKYSVKGANIYKNARDNRKEPTEAEAVLWDILRNRQINEKFRRQHPIEGYIADFACLGKALIVEVDGDYHAEKGQAEYDAERTNIFEELAFRVLRFTNEEVLNKPDEVITRIQQALKESSIPVREEKGDKQHVTPSPFMEKGPGDEVWTRETNTMPGYAGSSWYFLRYMDPHNGETFADRKATEYWREVDLYIGGTEHAVGHLLYSRMWTKALYDLGHISFEEPFKKLVNQGMIQGSTRFVYKIIGTKIFISKSYRDKLVHGNYYDSLQFMNIANDQLGYPAFVTDGDGVYPTWEAGKKVDGKQEADFNLDLYSVQHIIETRVNVNIVDGLELNIEEFKNWRQEYDNAEFILEDGKYICGAEVEKMSKSKYNVVNPDDIVNQFGADTFRMYEMFLGPIEMSKPWDTKGIEGVHRFLKKMWRLYNHEQRGWIVTDDTATEAELRALHKTIKKVTEDIERFSFNTCVSQFMICVNELATLNCHKREVLEKLAVLICPFAPHFAEELWHQFGHTTSVVAADFPKYEEKYVVENSKMYPVAVNGKTRVELEFPLDMEQASIEKEVLADPVIIKWLEGKAPKKVIYVKGKMINVVV